jgi:CDP-glycerol glycerophosphotransferase
VAEPLVSVVVPAFQVEAYLAACLDSVLSSQLTDLEVLCIDDGSSDGTGRIAEAYAARDPRVQVLHQANAGLGATRNRGVALATGRYLAFLDADDLVPPTAYAHMVASLEGSGSDLVTGDIRRLTSLGHRRSPTFSPIYRPARRATHVRRDHALLQDRIAPNKLFRTAFWRENDLRFPVGVLYEDTPVTLRAHVLARAVDVLDEVVYVWRIRQGADRSITQRRLEEQALIDRIAAVRDVSRFLRERGEAELARAYDRLALTDDLRLFARELDRADAAYQARFLTEAGAFVATVDPTVLDDAPWRERVRWHLVAAGDGPGLVALARHDRIDPAGEPARRSGAGLTAVLPASVATSVSAAVPDELLHLDAEVVLRTGVTDIRRDGPALVVEGFATLSHLDVTGPEDQTVTAWLRRVDGDETIPLALTPRSCPEASDAAPSGYDRIAAGFRTMIDARALADRWERGTDRWRLEVEVSAAGLARRGALGGIRAGGPRRPPAVDVGRLRVGPRIDRQVLDLVVAARPVRVTSARAEEGRLGLGLQARRPLTTLRLRAAGRADLLVPVTLGGNAAQVHLDPGAVLGRFTGAGTVALHALDDRGEARRLSAEDDVEHAFVDSGAGVLGVEVSRYGYLSLRLAPAVLLLDQLEARERGLVLAGQLLGTTPSLLQLRLVPDDRVDPRCLPVIDAGDGRVQVVIDASGLPTRAGVLHLVAGPDGRAAGAVAATHEADPPSEVSEDDEDGHGTDARGDAAREDGVLLRSARSLTAQLPVAVPTSRLPARLQDRSWSRLAIEVERGLAADEGRPGDDRRWWSSAVADREGGRLRRFVGRGRRALQPGVLVLASGGRSAGGCPGAIAAELRRRAPDLPITVAVADRAVDPSADTTTVAVGSRAFLEALARTETVVTDGPLPRAFERTEQQQVVRCWTGVPVRPLGGLGPGVRGAEQPEQAARAWSHVVAAGPTAATALRAAFDLDEAGCEVLETGLPRHDVLADPAARARGRAALRRRLQARDDTPVVVYLPTWVDAARHPGGRLRRLEEPDLGHLARELARTLRGRDGLAAPRLVVRGHPDVVDAYGGRPPGDAPPGGLVEVEDDVDAVDLLLAADVVLAQPSSVVLEAARVGVPVVLHDPAGLDLTRQLGAPLVDVVDLARPGALARDTREILAAVTDVLTGVASSDPGDHLERVTGAAAAAVAEALLRG